MADATKRQHSGSFSLCGLQYKNHRFAACPAILQSDPLDSSSLVATGEMRGWFLWGTSAIEEGVDMINCFDNSQKFLPGCVVVTFWFA